MVNVDILENDRSGGTLTTTVVVSHEQTQSVDYTVEVGLVDGPSETLSGTLPSSTGSFPGGSETATVEFDLAGMGQGTVYAELTQGGSERVELDFGASEGSTYPVGGDGDGLDIPVEAVLAVGGGAALVGLALRGRN